MDDKICFNEVKLCLTVQEEIIFFFLMLPGLIFIQVRKRFKSPVPLCSEITVDPDSIYHNLNSTITVMYRVSSSKRYIEFQKNIFSFIDRNTNPLHHGQFTAEHESGCICKHKIIYIKKVRQICISDIRTLFLQKRLFFSFIRILQQVSTISIFVTAEKYTQRDS